MNCISQALFGYDASYDNCYDFKSYIRYLSLNLRMYKLLFPQWIMHLTLDEQTYNSPYKEFFDYHVNRRTLNISVMPRKPLCEMMLFRMVPVFLQDTEGVQKYDRIICRDIDSLPTYRERQAVDYWIKNGRVAHAITDSTSHGIPLMGGMIGFQTNELRKCLEVRTFERMLELDKTINLSQKGSDQTFLNQVVLPRVSKSMTEHYVLGLPQSFRGDCFNYIQDITVEDIPPAMRETNILVNHIGQAGFIMEPVLKFLQKHEKNSEYFEQIERKYPDIFYWHITSEMLKKENND